MLAAFYHSSRACGLAAIFAPPPDAAFVGTEHPGLYIGTLCQSGSALFARILLIYGLFVFCCFMSGQTSALAIRLDGVHGYTEPLSDLLVSLSGRSHLVYEFFLCVSHM